MMLMLKNNLAGEKTSKFLTQSVFFWNTENVIGMTGNSVSYSVEASVLGPYILL